jgi:hypothetical protein
MLPKLLNPITHELLVGEYHRDLNMMFAYAENLENQIKELKRNNMSAPETQFNSDELKDSYAHKDNYPNRAFRRITESNIHEISTELLEQELLERKTRESKSLYIEKHNASTIEFKVSGSEIDLKVGIDTYNIRGTNLDRLSILIKIAKEFKEAALRGN